MMNVENENDSAQASRPVGQDLACLRCRYNLRGLPADGKCPECSEEVAVAIQNQQRLNERQLERVLHRTLPLAEQCDPRSLTQWAEGLSCILVSFVIATVGADLSFDGVFSQFGSNTRAVSLCIVVTGWVVGNWGAWKCGFQDWPRKRPSYLLRLSLIFFMLVPVSIALWESWHRWYRELDLILLALDLAIFAAGIVAMLALQIRLSRVCRIVGWPSLRWAFYLCVPILLLTIFFQPYNFPHIKDGDVSSLHEILYVFSPGHGSATVGVMVCKYHFRKYPQVLTVLGPVWALFTLAMLLCRTWKIRRRIRARSGALLAEIQSPGGVDAKFSGF